MSNEYLDNLEVNNQSVNYLINFCVKYHYDDVFTLYDTNIYRIPWTLQGPLVFKKGSVSIPTDPLITFAPAKSFSLLTTLDGYAGRFFYDDGYLYAYSTLYDLTDADNTSYFDLPINLATTDIAWSMIPDDADYAFVDYKGILISNPSISSSVSQTFFGFYPSKTNSFDCFNRDGMFDDLNDTFEISNGVVKIYRWVGDLRAENMRLVFNGFSRKITYNGERVTLSYVDMGALLDNPVERSTLRNEVTQDPSIAGTFKRVYFTGIHQRQAGYVASNYSSVFLGDENRGWNFGFNNTDFQNVGFPTVGVSDVNAGSNTTTRTYLDSVAGFSIGDWVQLAAQGTRTISAVGADYIDTTPAIASPLLAANTVSRSMVQEVNLVDNNTGVTYPLDLDHMIPSSTQGRVVLLDNIEGPLSLPGAAINPRDYTIYVTVETGNKREFLATGDFLGSPRSEGFNRNPVQTIYEILYESGFREASFYDQASFIELADTFDDEDFLVDVSSPKNFNSNKPETYREVLSKLCETALIKLYIKNGAWKVSRLEPLPAMTDQNIFRGNILENNFNYSINSEDLVKSVTVKYDYGDVNFVGKLTTDSWQTTARDNDNAVGQGDVSKIDTREVYTSDTTVAQTIRDRLFFIFTKSLGLLNISLGLENIDLDLSSSLTIKKEDFEFLPFADDKDFSIISIEEDIDSLSLQLFDQQGIENNSGDW